MENTNGTTGLNASKMLLLGIQHVFAMFGATVLVPALTGLDPAVALFTAGVGTLIFHVINRGKVPVFLGSSFAFILAINAVVNSQGIAYAGGGIIVAGLLYVALAVLVMIFGADRIRSFFPPLVTGPMIMVIGLHLGAGMIESNIMMSSVADAPGTLWQRLLVALVVVLTMIIVSLFVKGFFKLVPILFGIIAGYLVSVAFGFVDFAPIKEASMFSIPSFVLPKFSWDAILLIGPIAIVTFMEHIGDITTIGAVTGKDYFKDPGLHRTLIGDGIATAFAGCLGGPANTTYSENTGVIAVTKVANPRVVQIAAIIAILMSLIGKLGVAISTIPAPVMGGVSILLFGIIASVGLRTIAEADIDFSLSRNIIIVALMLVIGLSDIQIPIGSEEAAFSSLSIAAIIGVVLNKILPKDV